MAMDPLEKDRLRKKMALRMQVFLEGGKSVVAASSHYNAEPQPCELCQTTHANELFVIKNRSNKKMKLALSCLKEMIRFQVTDVEDLGKWLEKLPELRAEADARVQQEKAQREEERKRLEKKVIVRKRTTEGTV